MKILDSIQTIATGIGSVGVFIGFIIAWKSGLLSYVWNLKKNGSNGNGVNANELADGIAQKLATNHFHKMIENNNEAIQMSGEIVRALERIERKLELNQAEEMPVLRSISDGVSFIRAKQNGIK